MTRDFFGFQLWEIYSIHRIHFFRKILLFVYKGFLTILYTVHFLFYARMLPIIKQRCMAILLFYSFYQLKLMLSTHSTSYTTYIEDTYLNASR